MPTTSHKTKGVLLCLCGIILLSPDSLLLRLIGADLWTLAFWRGGLSAVGLAVAVLLMEGRQPGRQQLLRLTRQGVVVAVSFAIANLAFIFSIQNTVVANTLVIMSLSPLFAALLSYFLFREPISTGTWLAAVAIFLGLTMVFYGSLATGGVVGDLAALVTSLCVAISLVLMREHRDISMVPALAWSSGLACLAALPFASPASLSGTALILMLVLGLIVLPASLTMIGLAPRYLPAPEVGLYLLLETLIGPVIVWLLVAEAPRLNDLIGGAVLLSALIGLFSYRMHQSKRNKANC